MKPKMLSLVWLARTQFFALLLAALGFVAPWKAAAGSFTAMTTALPGSFSPGHMMLLSDGRVMVQASFGSAWKFLLPDAQGHYIDGTWSNCPSMNYAREYYSSDVLTDGRVFVAGGEYISGVEWSEPGGASAEIFDPQANGGTGSWTLINPPTSLLDPSQHALSPYGGYYQGFEDSESVLLPNGNVLVAPVFPSTKGGTLIYNPFSNIWSAGGTVATDDEDEASWVKLPDDSILTIDPYGTDCQRYIPALNTWIQDRPVPVNLYSTNGEIGAAMLLTNGTVLYFGGNNASEIYTPSPLGGTNWGSWSSGPNIPDGYCMRDAPACILNNGKLLVTFVSFNGDSPLHIFEYNQDNNSFTEVLTAGYAISDKTSMLQLPDGNVLFNDTGTVYVYQPDPSPISAGRPTIYSVSWNTDGSLHLTGTLFNGISQGAVYGDDAQQDNNYPLVKFTSGSTVYYGRTYNWSSTSVRTGGEIMTTEVAVPPAVLDVPADWSLQVIANGNASAAWNFYSPVWVDFNYSGFPFQFGWYPFPYNTLPQGVSAIASSYPGGTIAIKSSTGHETVPYTISTPMTIISVNGPSTIGN